MDIFETECPRISEVYIHYINSQEYINNKLIRRADENFYRVIDSSFSDKCTTDILDNITSAVVDCEQAGFTIGFAYAFSLIKEADKLNNLFTGGSGK